MRIWSRRLIPYLPKKQLLAMRYELGDMIKQYPNIRNGLTSFANNYDCWYLGLYFVNVCNVIAFKGYNMNEKYNNDIIKIASEKSFFDDNKIMSSTIDDLHFREDNKRYLKICLINLFEKYLRGLIPQDEWETIENNFNYIKYFDERSLTRAYKDEVKWYIENNLGGGYTLQEYELMENFNDDNYNNIVNSMIYSDTLNDALMQTIKLCIEKELLVVKLEEMMSSDN